MRRHPRLTLSSARLALSLTSALLLALPSAWAGDVLVALDDEERANASNDYEQEWGKIAMAADGSGYAVAWDSALFHTLWLRYFDIDGVALGQDILVNDTLDQNIQDEPMIAMDAIGRVLVCWSDRNGYDGFQMGCFGRAYGGGAACREGRERLPGASRDSGTLGPAVRASRDAARGAKRAPFSNSAGSSGPWSRACAVTRVSGRSRSPCSRPVPDRTPAWRGSSASPAGR